MGDNQYQIQGIPSGTFKLLKLPINRLNSVVVRSEFWRRSLSSFELPTTIMANYLLEKLNVLVIKYFRTKEKLPKEDVAKKSPINNFTYSNRRY